MARFVPKDKLSKKAQKELNRQQRTMWDFSPVSRAVDSKKLYNRKRNTRDRYDNHWNPVDKEEATMCDIHEYDENGTLIQSTIGYLNQKKGGNQYY